MGYLKEIINLDTKQHQELAEGIGYYFPKLLKQGFLYEYKASGQAPRYTPESQNLHMFHGLWCIFGELNSYAINEDAFFEQDWEEFKAASEHIHWVHAFQKEVEETITGAKEQIHILIRNVSFEALEKEKLIFQEWYEQPEILTDLNPILLPKFRRWCRRFEFRKKGRPTKSSATKGH